MKPTDEKIIMDLQNDIELLRKINIENNEIEIVMDGARWIGDGSGTINNSIRFYLDKETVFYVSDDTELINFFNKIELGIKIKEIIKKQGQINLIMNSYY